MAEVADVTEKGDRREIADEGDWRTRGETEVTKNGDREKERKEKAKEGERREMTTNGDREKEREETETASEGDQNKETTEDEKCGIGTCHPQVMQRFSRVIFFTLSLSFSGFCSLLTGPMLVSQVTSIERQFGMNSTQVGALMSANDIGFALTVLVISHFAKDAHIPRILSVATFVFGIASIFIAAMNFVRPHSLQNLDAAVNSSEARTKQLKYLCVPNLPNTTFDDGGCDDTEARLVDSSVPLVVAIGLLLSVQGITKATRAPLGVTYIDNNVPCRSKTGLHIGINLSLVLFGPPVGLAMGGFFSRIPVDLSDTTLKPTDPRWIGAWWMGFLLVGALAIVSSLPMLFFPRRLPLFRAGGKNEAQETAKSRDEEADDMSTTKYGASSGRKQTGNELEANGDSQDRTMEVEKAAQVEDLKRSPGSEMPRGMSLQVLKDLPRSLLRLVQNPMYVILVMAFNFQIFALVGFASFLIKFVQRQFHIPPWLSSYVFGLSNLVLSGLGTFIGGLLVSRWNLTRRNCLRWAIVAHSIAVLLGAVTLGLGCDPTPMVGLHNHDFVLDDGLSTCECDVSQYLPVCDGNRTFLSPCHAGCSSAANSTHFLDCELAARPEVTVGVCSPGCYLLIPFVVVQVLSSFFSSTAVTPSYVTILRSVSLTDKTLGLGVVSFVMSLLAFIPAPIVFGAVVDRACLIWSSTCGKSGACALYDVTKLRYSYIGVEIGIKATSLGLYALALFVLLWQVRTGRTKDEKPTMDLGNKSVCEEDGSRKSRLSSGPRALEMTHF